MASSRLVTVGLIIMLLMSFGVTTARADVGELRVEWQQFLPGISGVDLIQTSDGGFLVLGENATVQKIEEWVPRPGEEEKHIYVDNDNVLVKTDSNGNALWAKTYHIENSLRLEPYKIIQTSDRNYLIATVWISENEPGKTSPASPPKICLLKIDPDGNLLWSKLLQGYNPEHSDTSGFSIESLVENSDGDFELTTSYVYQMKSHGIWFVKVDSSGNLEENRNLSSINQTTVSTIWQTNDGGYVFARPNTTYVVWIGKVDKTGNLEAEIKIRTNDPYGNIAPNAIIQADDGGYVFAGTWDITSDAGNRKMWLVKIGSTVYPSFETWVKIIAIVIAAVSAVGVGLAVHFKKIRFRRKRQTRLSDYP